MSFNSTNDSIVCATTLRLVRTPSIYIVHGVTVCFGILGLLCNVPFVFALWHHKTLHRNLRILLANHSICTSLLCAGVLIQESYYLYSRSGATADSSCEIRIQSRLCTNMAFPRIVSIHLSIFSMAATAAERAFATWKFKNYELHTSLKLPIVLMLIQVMYAA